MSKTNPNRKKTHVDRKRPKKRYFLIQFDLPREQMGQVFATSEDLTASLFRSVIYCYGIVGESLFQRNIRVKYFNAKTCITIVRVPFAFERMFRNVIPSVQTINNISCKLKTIHVSGTIIQAQKHLLEYNRKLIKETGRGDKEENIMTIKHSDY